MEDCCAVCAEPLEWTAYGPCGHTEACSSCVTRLRFVLGDQRCVICQQHCPSVMVTRFLGSFTVVIPATAFSDLPAKRKAGQIYHVPAAGAYFDDKAECSRIESLCSYTHNSLRGPANGAALQFPSLRELKSHLVKKHLHFCDLCLEGRKVFISEQILYSKEDLDRHLRIGDTEGPLADSGFKGHPNCRFCRRRYYGDNEIYAHMQTSHEQCFLCRRAQPNKFVYYRDYRELEEHFHHAHHPCEHVACLERKFVVFPSEQELRQHCAREHGGNMSKAEKRQALTIPINVQFRRDAEEAAHAAQQRPGSSGRGAPAAPGPIGITIGGPGNVRSRFARRNLPTPDVHISSALQASLESARVEAALRDSAGASAAPAPAEAAPPGGGEPADKVSNGPVLASTGPTRWAAAATPGGGAGSAPRPEDFPALPGTSKSAKRRMKEKEKTLAERLAAAGSVQVVPPGAPRPLQPTPQDFPRLGHSISAPTLNSGPDSQEVPAPQQSGAALRQAGNAAAPHTQGLMANAARARDFPALVSEVAQPAAAAASAQDSPLPPAGGVSESLKAANKALLEKVRLRVEPGEFQAFRRNAGAYMHGAITAEAYHRDVVALGLANLVPEMAALLPDDAKRSQLLAAHRAFFPQSGPAAGPDAFEPPGGHWVPPEAAAAAAAHADAHGLWTCPQCTLLNAPTAVQCEACSHVRHVRPLDAGLRPTVRSAPGAEVHWEGQSSSEASGITKPGPSAKVRKVPRFERLRLTGGDAAATQAWLETTGGTKQAVKPQNVWTQRRNPAVGGGTPQVEPGALRGQWAKGGRLAEELGGVAKAWAKP